MTSHLEQQGTVSAMRGAPLRDEQDARHPGAAQAGAALAALGQNPLRFPIVPVEPAADRARLPAWEVRLVATEVVGRVVAEATLADDVGPVLAAHGSARLSAGSTPEAARSAVNLATARALRRLAEVALRSAHEPAQALRARTGQGPGSVELVVPARSA